MACSEYMPSPSGGLIAATPASALNRETGKAPAQQRIEILKEKKICRRMAATGSRLAAKRICRTAAQWRTAQEQDF